MILWIILRRRCEPKRDLIWGRVTGFPPESRPFNYHGAEGRSPSAQTPHPQFYERPRRSDAERPCVYIYIYIYIYIYRLRKG